MSLKHFEGHSDFFSENELTKRKNGNEAVSFLTFEIEERRVGSVIDVCASWPTSLVWSTGRTS